MRLIQQFGISGASIMVANENSCECPLSNVVLPVT